MGKQYSEAKAIGNAGAFKFGELVTRMFRWPVRLIDESTDLGVDAEIEICDQDGNTTGKIIKAQIKSTKLNPNVEATRCYLKKKDLDYLCSLSLPVIIVYVNISIHSGVYWRPLNAEQMRKETPHCFEFNQEDRLEAGAKSALEQLETLERE